MAFQPDLILRLIEEFSRVLARLAALRQRGEAAAAVSEAEAAARSLFGIDLALLERLPIEAVARQLGHPQRVGALGRLLSERAELARAQGDDLDAARWASRAEQLLALAAAAR